jgi:hypothetical protein
MSIRSGSASGFGKRKSRFPTLQLRFRDRDDFLDRYSQISKSLEPFSKQGSSDFFLRNAVEKNSKTEPLHPREALPQIGAVHSRIFLMLTTLANRVRSIEFISTTDRDLSPLGKIKKLSSNTYSVETAFPIETLLLQLAYLGFKNVSINVKANRNL